MHPVSDNSKHLIGGRKIWYLDFNLIIQNIHHCKIFWLDLGLGIIFFIFIHFYGYKDKNLDGIFSTLMLE